MAEGLLLFYYFPNTSQSASLTAPLKGSLPIEGENDIWGRCGNRALNLVLFPDGEV